MSAAPQAYHHPRVELPRSYYMPPTRAMAPLPAEPAPSQPAPTQPAPTQPAPTQPARRHLPVVLTEEDVARIQRRRIASAVLDAAEKASATPAPAVDPLALPAATQRTRGQGGGRGLTLSMKRFSKRALALGEVWYPVAAHAFGEGRPRTFEECCAIGLGSEIPCPFVSCAHHLYLDVGANGSIKINFPEHDVLDLQRTCGRVIAEADDADEVRANPAGDLMPLDAIGDVMNLTRERVRQLETRAQARIRGRIADGRVLRELHDASLERGERA